MHLKPVIYIYVGSKAWQLIYFKVFTCVFAHKGYVSY